MITSKHCPKCEKEVPLENWSRNKARKDGLASWCKSCMNEYHRRWRANPEVKKRQAELAAQRYAAMSDEERKEYNLSGTLRRRERGYHLHKKYGLSLDEYDAMLEQQGGGCAICGKEPSPNKRLSVDHDHKCCPGETTCGNCIRGLLCITCNVWLGFYENEQWVMKAKNYIERNSND